MQDQETERLLRYLFAELEDAERLRVEEEFFTNDEVYQDLLALEDELLYDYLQNTLPEDQQKKVEAHLLPLPGNQGRQLFRSALIEKLKSQQSPIRRNYNWLAAVAAVLFVGTLSWLLFENFQLRSEVRDLQRSQAALQQQSNAAQKTSQNLTPEPIILTFTLHPGQVRSGGGLQQLIVPNPSAVIHLRLSLKAKAQKYQAVATDPDGHEVWGDIVFADHDELTLSIPAKVLPPNDYQLTIHSTGTSSEEIESYYFSVQSR